MTEEILEEAALAPSELIELFKHRSATYGLLSRLYAKEVDAELLDELHDTLWPVETGSDAGDEGNHNGSDGAYDRHRICGQTNGYQRFGKRFYEFFEWCTKMF